MKSKIMIACFVSLAFPIHSRLLANNCDTCQVGDSNVYSFEHYVALTENDGSHDNLDVATREDTLLVRGNMAFCNTLSNRGWTYAPYFKPNPTDGTLDVRINLIFIQKDDGSGNFQEDDLEHQQLFDDAMADLNHIYANLVLPDSTCYDGPINEFISNAKIRFLDNRLYVRSSRFWNNRYTEDSVLCPYRYHIIDDSIVADANIPRGINIYFTEDSIVYEKYWIEQNTNDTSDFVGIRDACAYFPVTNDLYHTSRIHMPDYYSNYWHMKYIIPQKGSFNYPLWYPTVYGWLLRTLSHGLAHEIGHSLGLDHPKDDSIPYPSSSCTASIMYSGLNPRNFLPPNEIGRMYVNAMCTNVRQFIPDTTYLGNKTFSTTLTFPNTRFYHSIILTGGSYLTFPCDVTMPQNAYIQVNNNATCEISDGYVHSVTNVDWKGIHVNSGGILYLSNTTIDDYNIVVEDGGTIIVDGELNISGDHYIKVNDGGCICIDEHADITLADPFSIIDLSPNALIGCDVPTNTHCVESISDVTTSGNGKIVTYTTPDYIQNETISTNRLGSGSTVMVGYDVTNTKPFGNVVVTPNGNLRIQSTGDVVITRGLEVQMGGVLEIK